MSKQDDDPVSQKLDAICHRVARDPNKEACR